MDLPIEVRLLILEHYFAASENGLVVTIFDPGCNAGLPNAKAVFGVDERYFHTNVAGGESILTGKDEDGLKWHCWTFGTWFDYRLKGPSQPEVWTSPVDCYEVEQEEKL